MTERNSWADTDRKWALVDERKFMWHESQISWLASVIGLTSGQTIADIGCGLGYLGWTYWEHYGAGGTYLGLDCSSSLIADAVIEARSWSEGGNAAFINGDAYSIPLMDGSVDVAMCQTLLTHLEYPEKALREMIRITKPDGSVVCQELDNVSQFMKLSYSSVTDDEDIDEILFYRKMRLILARARKALGLGDLGIGSKIPRMMHEAGLTEIRGFCNERLEFLLPPYEEPEQNLRVEIMGRNDHDSTEEERHEAKEHFRERYLAGGGDSSSFDSDYERLMGIAETRRLNRQAQLQAENLFSCSGGSNFFCIIGKKIY